MKVWRRAIALLVMIVFVPATVLAAMPFKYCIGADGHRGVEWVTSTSHHAAVEEIEHASGGAEAGSFDWCVDAALLNLAQAPSRDAPKKSGLTDQQPLPAILVSQPASASPLLRSLYDLGRDGRQVACDPRLATLRTVVLLN